MADPDITQHAPPGDVHDARFREGWEWNCALAAVRLDAAPPDELPAVLSSVEDVARVCEARGLVRITGEDMHPNAWRTTDWTIGVAIAGLGRTMTGIYVALILDRDAEEQQEIGRVIPYVSGGGPLLWHVIGAAIQAARGGEPRG